MGSLRRLMPEGEDWGLADWGFGIGRVCWLLRDIAFPNATPRVIAIIVPAAASSC